ncbi:helix-turn-helix transcriptional regulator [Methylotuvimicrobium buryatense]|uniref:HTH domain-containing protein n=1 Tax=Methylotuvimicrobium buryatense TaxID=95641 RepID=A0A4V1IJM3_METBY|nr:HTH domain-containing protein [Methylotuvimicrobium buryatense]QCW81905.1 HTH domain-containing protein [Methylotuvimicrobium buryatense]
MDKQIGSRQEQILKLLLTAETGLSINELAAELSISRNAVTQHILSLERNQMICETSLFNNTGGRPSRSYRLTEQTRKGLPKQYAWFSDLLLSELAVELGSEALQKVIWKLGVEQARLLKAQFAGKDLEQTLPALIEVMENLGYHPELERQHGQISIKVSHCVYHELAQQHPELCRFDQALITTVLSRPIEQTACVAKMDCVCRFSVDVSE